MNDAPKKIWFSRHMDWDDAEELVKFCDSHCTWLDHHPDCPLKERYISNSPKTVEPESEPVGWMDDPVAYIDGPNNMLIWAKPFQYCGPKCIHVHPIPLYLHPPTRLFMRLSDKEIEMVMDNALLPNEIDEYDIFHFARAVEDALDEKNK